MTRFVFWEDAYLTHLKTEVEKVDGNQLILKETIAYAESGGQESDRVTINGFEVLQSTLRPLEEVHHLHPPCGAWFSRGGLRHHRDRLESAQSPVSSSWF